MQAAYDLAAPSAPSLQFDVMREIFRLLEPYQVGGRMGGKGLTPQTMISTGTIVDSLTIMDVIMELEDRFDVSIPLGVSADIGTIDQLAETVVRLATRR
jgi:acyl carrier protein